MTYSCTSGGQSLGFWILGPNIEQFFALCFFCTMYCEVQNVIQQSKPTEPGATAEFHNPEHEHSGMLPGLSKQLSRLTIPGELKAVSQSMEMRTLWELAFALIRINRDACLFFSFDLYLPWIRVPKLKSIPRTRKPTVLFVSSYCLSGLAPWTQWRRIFKGLLKNLFFAGDCVQPQETNTGEGWEKQQTLKALSHASLLFSESLVVHTACSLWGRSHGGEGGEGIFQFPEETTSPCPSPSWNGNPPRESKGMHSPRRCASSKTQGFAWLKKCSRRALNHVLWWERHFCPG